MNKTYISLAILLFCTCQIGFGQEKHTFTTCEEGLDCFFESMNKNQNVLLYTTGETMSAFGIEMERIGYYEWLHVADSTGLIFLATGTRLVNPDGEKTAGAPTPPVSTQVCLGPRSRIKKLLEKWSSGGFSSGDFEGMDCYYKGEGGKMPESGSPFFKEIDLGQLKQSKSKQKQSRSTTLADKVGVGAIEFRKSNPVLPIPSKSTIHLKVLYPDQQLFQVDPNQSRLEVFEDNTGKNLLVERDPLNDGLERYLSARGWKSYGRPGFGLDYEQVRTMTESVFSKEELGFALPLNSPEIPASEASSVRIKGTLVAAYYSADSSSRDFKNVNLSEKDKFHMGGDDFIYLKLSEKKDYVFLEGDLPVTRITFRKDGEVLQTVNGFGDFEIKSWKDVDMEVNFVKPTYISFPFDLKAGIGL